MREHTFLHKRETRDVNVVTPAPKGRLGNTIPQQHHGSGAIDNNRTTATEIIKGAAVENVEAHGGGSGTEFRGASQSLSQVTSTD